MGFEIIREYENSLRVRHFVSLLNGFFSQFYLVAGFCTRSLALVLSNNLPTLEKIWRLIGVGISEVSYRLGFLVAWFNCSFTYHMPEELISTWPNQMNKAQNQNRILMFFAIVQG